MESSPKSIEEAMGVLSTYQKVAKDIVNAHEKVQGVLIETLLKNQNEIILRLDQLGGEVKNLRQQLMSRGMPSLNEYEIGLGKIEELVASKEWPEAVDEALICRTEEERLLRAELNLRLLEFPKGKKYLDVGCGEGHFVVKASEMGATIAVGYDIKESWKFPSDHNRLFTTEKATVANYGPYDFITMHDVLDHFEQDELVPALKALTGVLAPRGLLKVRCHPWTSRTGGHLYEFKNKAFLHLVLDDEEMLRMFGFCKPFPLMQEINPLVKYDEWFRYTGYEILDKSVNEQEVEDFFHTNDAIHSRINKIVPNFDWLKINFIDYTLRREETQIII